MFNNFSKIKYTSGVTLIELLVVISIFMVISSITIFSYGKFNSSLSTANLADDIALSIRRAQGYAIGVHKANNSFNYGYGVHFTTKTNPSNQYDGSNRSFVLFADVSNPTMYKNNNNLCGASNLTNTNECLELLSITNSDYIARISYTTSLGTSYLSGDNVLDITFKRPNPEPTFCYRNSFSASSCNQGIGISSVNIDLSNDKNPGVYKSITVYSNGQIHVSD